MITLLVVVSQFSFKILPPLSFEPIRSKTNPPFSADDTCCLSSFDEFNEFSVFAVTPFDFCFGSSPTQ